MRANDGTNTGTWGYAVTVTNINERPELTAPITTDVTYDENDANETYISETVVSYTARDEEGGVTWSLTGTDSSDFAIDSMTAPSPSTPRPTLKSRATPT